MSRAKPYDRPPASQHARKESTSGPSGLLGSLFSKIWQRPPVEAASKLATPQPALSLTREALDLAPSIFRPAEAAALSRSPSLSRLQLRSPSPALNGPRALPGSSLFATPPVKRTFDQVSPEPAYKRAYGSPFHANPHRPGSPSAASVTSSVTSARKRQMVWSPTKGFVALAPRVEVPKEKLPVNEAERILNTLESMRASSKPVRVVSL